MAAMETPPETLRAARLYLPKVWRVVAGLVIATLFITFFGALSGVDDAFIVIALLAFLTGLLSAGIALVAVIGLITRPPQRGYFAGSLLGGLAMTAVSAFASLMAFLTGAGGFGIAPWGRPLRIRGRMVHPELRPGEAWAEGSSPRCDELSPATREALATLWHHDAQKEHASVPAFSRLAWLLAGLGAPPQLLEGAHHAGLQEIDHARRCFALAGGYAGAPLSVEPIPELLSAPLGVGRDPLLAVAVESLRDGCLIEDFNADVARVAADHARDPAALELATIIARDEREHAELAWQILEWCIASGDAPLRRAIARAAETLPAQGPRAYAEDETELVAAADPEAMIAHGRVPPEQWAGIFARRRALTVDRVRALLQAARDGASPAQASPPRAA